MSTAAYVRMQSQTLPHACHWPGCSTQVPPAIWGCRKHWFALPASIRSRIWSTYRQGQEVDMRPSEQYIDAETAAQEWIRARGAKEQGNSNG